MTTIVLLSDDTVFSLGLASLASGSDWEVVRAGSDRRSVTSALSRASPDVVVLDEETTDLALCGEIGALYPKTPLLVFGGERRSDEAVVAAVRAGARGFVLKSAEPEQMLTAIASVAAGHGFLDPSVTLRVISWAFDAQEVDYPAGLSPREMEVLGYVIEGEPNKRIAKRMGLSENTVKTYLRRAYRKLNCHTRSAAAAKLAREGLL